MKKKNAFPLQSQSTPLKGGIQELSENDLAFICGGRSKEDEQPVSED